MFDFGSKTFTLDGAVKLRRTIPAHAMFPAVMAASSLFDSVDSSFEKRSDRDGIFCEPRPN